MKCENLEILLSGYVDNELSQEQKIYVEKAINSSDTLRQKVEELHIVKQQCNSLIAPLPTNCSWDKFNKDLWEKMDDETVPTGVSFLQKACFTVAIVLFIVVSLFLPNFYASDSFSLSYTPLVAFPEKSNVEHKLIKVNAKIPKYEVPINIRYLKEANLSQREIQFLYQKGFVVTKNKFGSFNEIYEKNQRNSIPSYVTVDTAISGFSHILGRLRIDVEEKALYGRLASFTEIISYKLMDLHKKIAPQYEKASLRALAFIRVASVLLDLHQQWPKEISLKIEDQVKKELKLIYTGENDYPVEIVNSPIFGYAMDYSRFKLLRKSKNKRLERYLLAHEWYARCLFRIADNHSKIIEQHLSETRSAMLLLMATVSTDGMSMWEEIHYILTALYGQADDPHLIDYLKTARKIYGSTITLDVLSQKDKLLEFCKAISRTRLPKIRSELGLQSGLRIFSRRSIGCDFILQQLTYPYVGELHLPRVDPSLLDIAVIMGWHKAKYIAEEKGYYRYKGYETTVRKYQNRLEKELQPSSYPWGKGGLISLAWMLNSLKIPEGKGAPMFSHSEQWQARKLTSVACGLLDLSFGQPIFTGESTLNLKGTIEPYPEFFNRMATKIEHFEEVLQHIGYPLKSGVAKELVHYKKMLKKLAVISSKMLENKELTKKDYSELCNFVLGWEGKYGSATIQDISTMYYRNSSNFDNHLYAGVGAVYEMWVAIPINGKVQFARGGIFGYHEFQSMRQVSQEKWQELFSRPGLASWMDEYAY
ncbi:DUF3160 domain-containing protein [Candidatus Uabimicrobium sp. HlEnr_7]|uniref:DUF3160 domain-containing protein n=1 Tax=Candidatus Uabimicrobium helgolandensis TaxID=3095367 RepID=UPI0035566FE8